MQGSGVLVIGVVLFPGVCISFYRLSGADLGEGAIISEYLHLGRGQKHLFLPILCLGSHHSSL